MGSARASPRLVFAPKLTLLQFQEALYTCCIRAPPGGLHVPRQSPPRRQFLPAPSLTINHLPAGYSRARSLLIAAHLLCDFGNPLSLNICRMGRMIPTFTACFDVQRSCASFTK